MLKFLILCSLTVLTLGATIEHPEEDLKNLGDLHPHGRIVGGIKTDISKVPYQLALENNGRQFCGASILTPKIAITAAHCLSRLNATSMSVRTGSSKHESGGSLHNVIRALKHENYSLINHDFDVGLVFLDSPIKLGDNSKAISIIDKEPTSGSILISGWGDLEEGAGKASEDLMSVTVPMADMAACKRSYAALMRLTPRMFCAGTPGKDSCQGDSGGPAVVDGKLAGVVSFGIGCARPNYPGVYASLANPDIREWIRKHANV